MMARRMQSPDDRALVAFVAASVMAHVLVVGLADVLKPNVQRIAPVYNVRLVTSSPGGGRRAEAPAPKGNPKAKAPAAQKVAPQPAPKPEPVKKPAPRAAAKAQPIQKAVAKPDAKAPKTQPVSNAAAASETQKSDGANLKSALAGLKDLMDTRGSESGHEGGTKIQEGSFGAGEGGKEVGALAIQIYAGQVQAAIQRQWTMPGELARRNLVVQLGLRVSADGVVSEVWVDKSSGVGIFDESAMRAVRAASPLPVPPQTKNGYFEFYSRFTPEGARSN